MSSDWEIKMSQARDKLPLRTMMQQRGKHVPPDRKNFKCPYCESDSASLFHPHGSRNEMFKCFSTKCPTRTNDKGGAWDEVKFLAYELGISERDAAIQYLKEAGVWVETDRTSPSVMPGKQRRKHKRPEPPPAASGEPKVEGPKPADEEPKAEPAPAPEKPAEEKPAEPEPPKVLSPEAGDVVQSERPPADPAPAVSSFKPVVVPRNEEIHDGYDDLPAGQRVLDAFYFECDLSASDEKQLFIKRGLESETSYRLGYVSSPESNRQILERLAGDHPWEECQASGLFLPENPEKRLPRRPNSQFFGLGQKGKKPKEDRRGDDDRWIWGQTHPVLIPYFNELGKIVKLRPHKGGAPANTLCGTSRIYVPRDFRRCADQGEYFRQVIITEGDFKAAAIWQTLGTGRRVHQLTCPPPFGVVGIPGINFANNLELRSELDAWLRSVGCEEVTVVFDNEDKSEKPQRDRFDAVIWARYLASDLARKLHIVGKVGMLKNEWRDEKKKADWDGVLAKFIHESEFEQIA